MAAEAPLHAIPTLERLGHVIRPLGRWVVLTRQPRAAGRRPAGCGLDALEQVERPELARVADRAALAMLGMAGAEVVAAHPGHERLLGAPLGDDEAGVAVVVGPQQFEP